MDWSVAEPGLVLGDALSVLLGNAAVFYDSFVFDDGIIYFEDRWVGALFWKTFVV